MAPMRGWYVALEGSEGCGKSSIARRLADDFGAVATRETGGTEVGRRLREILHDTAVTTLDERAEALMIAADRAEHLTEVVEPALAAGRNVVSDRSVYSSLAYQGYGRGLDLAELRAVNEWAIRGCWPDLVVLLDLPAEVAASRMAGRDLDRFEREDEDFHESVRAGFRALAAAEPQRWVVVDATPNEDEVYAAVRAEIVARWGEP